MSRYVVDASVAVKWFIPEIHSEAAVRLLGETRELSASDLLLPEFGNILWKKIRLGQVSLEQGRQILKDFQALPLQIYASAPLMSSAFDVANSLGRSVYDSLYLALAATDHCQMLRLTRNSTMPSEAVP